MRPPPSCPARRGRPRRCGPARLAAPAPRGRCGSCAAAPRSRRRRPPRSRRARSRAARRPRPRCRRRSTCEKADRRIDRDRWRFAGRRRDAIDREPISRVSMPTMTPSCGPRRRARTTRGAWQDRLAASRRNRQGRRAPPPCGRRFGGAAVAEPRLRLSRVLPPRHGRARRAPASRPASTSTTSCSRAIARFGHRSGSRRSRPPRAHCRRCARAPDPCR